MDVCSNGSDGVLFFKMSGHGNDFIVIDNIDGYHALDWRKYSSIWCQRRLSVGADGILIIEKSERADFRLRIFNSDGSEAEMCGNGARCAAVLASLRNRAGSHMTFETMAGIIRAQVEGDRASIQLTDPREDQGKVELDIDGEHLTLHCINTGVPHAVLFVKNIWDIPGEEIKRTGHLIRFHSIFKPEGTNVDFVEVLGPGNICVRTYERGVEAETMACGTGAAAAALITHLHGNGGDPPFSVKVPEGMLEIDFHDTDSHISDVWLTGRVSCACKGYLSYKET